MLLGQRHLLRVSLPWLPEIGRTVGCAEITIFTVYLLRQIKEIELKCLIEYIITLMGTVIDVTAVII